MLPVLPGLVGFQDVLDVLLGELVAVGDLHALLRGVQEEGAVVRLGLFQHQDAGGNGGAEEKIVRQLNDPVDEVVVDEVLADFLLRPAPVHHPGKADDGGSAVGGQPGEAVHDKGQVRLGLGGQHPGRGEAGVVDEGGVAIPLPLDGVGGIGDDDLKRLVVPVFGVGEGVPVGNVKLVVVDVVEEHVDPAEVVGGQVDLLAKETLAHHIPAQDLGSLQQQGAGATGGVVDFVDLALVPDGDAGEQFRHFLGGEVFPAALACVGGVHAHKVFVGVPEGVNGVVLVVAQLHVAYPVEELDQLFVPLGHGGPQLVAVDVDVIKEALEVILALAALGGVFNGLEDGGQGLVEVLVLGCSGTDIGKQLAGEDEEALGGDQVLPGLLGILIGEEGIVKPLVACFLFSLVDVIGKVFGDVSVKQHTQDVLLKVPAVYAAPQVVGNGPNGAVEFLAFLFLFMIRHGSAPFLLLD